MSIDSRFVDSSSINEITRSQISCFVNFRQVFIDDLIREMILLYPFQWNF